MKKLCIVSGILMLLFTATSAVAQDEASSPKFRFGMKGAPSLAWMKPDSKIFESAGSRMRFAYGLITEFKIGNNYSFSTGLEVTYAGGILNYRDSVWYFGTAGDTSSFFLLKKRRLNLQYVDLPLLLKMKTKEIGYLTYFGQFGFDLGVNIKSRAEDEGSTWASTQTVKKEDVDIIKDINFMRIAMNLGIGIEYNIAGNTSLLIAANYSNGFTNVMTKESKSLKDTKGAAIPTKSVSNYVALTVGVLF